ncbi:MAG TPA: hypoxanthine phosphoribosyltransferase [Chitinophagaceae bacterium]|jgi:hypoxanthine phosphoribosyltransferase
MSTLRVHDKDFQIYLPEHVIQDRVQILARAITEDYAGRRPLFIAILNGSFMFAADLFKFLAIEAEITFIKLASYKGMRSTGNVITSIGLDAELFGRDLVIIEDIVDTGKTLYNFLPKLQDHHPASLKITALLHKPEAAKYPLQIDYTGFSIPDKFVIGYGLDYDGLGRNLKDIYQVV